MGWVLTGPAVRSGGVRLSDGTLIGVANYPGCQRRSEFAASSTRLHNGERHLVQRRWQLIQRRTKRRLVDDHRLDVLRSRVCAREEAGAIRAYRDAIESRRPQRHRRDRRNSDKTS